MERTSDKFPRLRESAMGLSTEQKWIMRTVPEFTNFQRRPSEVFLHFSNEKYYNIGNFS